MLVTFPEKARFVRLVQASKALSSITLTLSGIVTSDKALQPAKVPFAIVVTPSGITMLVKLIQSLNAL